MRNSTATIADVARLAGVSTAVVSLTLNDRGRVAEVTRQRVKRAAEELGYVANFAARSLRGGRTNLLGVVVHDLTAQYFATIVHGANEAAIRGGRDLVLYTTSADQERERERVGALNSGLADGILIIAPRNSDDYLQTLERSRVPVVLVSPGGLATHLPSVGGDNYGGMRAATQHLIGWGHSRIGFIVGNPKDEPSRERLRAYREGLHEASLPFDASLVIPGNFTVARGFSATEELLNLDDPPSAILAANDLSAFGVIEAVKSRGLRVPDDVSVVGFDDIPMAGQSYPPLTTVRHPLHDMGEQAVKRLLALIEGGTVGTEQLELPSELIVRASTGPVSAVKRQ